MNLKTAAIALGLSLPAFAGSDGVVRIPGSVTSIVGNATRMVSYRDQNHSWQTRDGAMHLLVNLGDSSAGAGLALYSSFDNGASWNQIITLADTDQNSTDDGVLTRSPTRETLQLVYGTSHGAIKYAIIAYDSTLQTWSVVDIQSAYSASGIIASNPAFAADTAGNLWCAFTEENSSTLEYQQELIYQAAGSRVWVDTGLIFGQVDNSSQHSARPVPYAGGIGVLYQDETTLYWAYRLNSVAFNEPWLSSTLYVGLPTAVEDPYDTHYSVVADADNNLYLAFVGEPAAELDLNFTVFSSGANSWGPMQTLESSINDTGYPQVSIVDDKTLLLMVNHSTDVEVLQSTNFGVSFRETQMLTHPPGNKDASYRHPRVEAPRHATSPIPVWQQFVAEKEDRLLFFQVPRR
jgi:hypothetical protein